MRIEWDEYHVELHEVGRTLWERGIKTPRNWLPSFINDDSDLLYIIGGEGRIRLARGWTKLRPGMCLWLRPGVHYHAEQNPDHPLSSNFFHFDLVDSAGRVRSPRAPLPAEAITPPDIEMAGAITRRIVDMSFGFKVKGYVNRIPAGPVSRVAHELFKGLLMELDALRDDSAALPLTGLARQQRRLVHEAAATFLDAPHDRQRCRQAVRQSGYSPEHFARLFRRHAGVNPEQFIIRARVRRAERMLRESDMSVTQIAEALGYSDIFHFSRQFKKLAGSSPSEYRQRE